MDAIMKSHQIRGSRSSPDYLRVTSNNPPLNRMDSGFTFAFGRSRIDPMSGNRKWQRARRNPRHEFQARGKIEAAALEMVGN